MRRSFVKISRNGRPIGLLICSLYTLKHDLPYEGMFARLQWKMNGMLVNQTITRENTNADLILRQSGNGSRSSLK